MESPLPLRNLDLDMAAEAITARSPGWAERGLRVDGPTWLDQDDAGRTRLLRERSDVVGPIAVGVRVSSKDAEPALADVSLYATGWAEVAMWLDGEPHTESIELLTAEEFGPLLDRVIATSRPPRGGRRAWSSRVRAQFRRRRSVASRGQTTREGRLRGVTSEPILTPLEEALRTLALALKGRATDAVEEAVGVPLDPRIDDSVQEIEHGEAGIALQNLAQNLFEFEVALSQDEYDSFAEIGQAMGLPPRDWAFLSDLVVERS